MKIAKNKELIESILSKAQDAKEYLKNNEVKFETKYIEFPLLCNCGCDKFWHAVFNKNHELIELYLNEYEKNIKHIIEIK